MSHTRTSVLLGLVLGQIGGGLFPYAKLGTFWAWYRDMQDKISSSKLLRTETIRRQNAVGIFRLVSYTHLGTFLAWYGGKVVILYIPSISDRISKVKTRSYILLTRLRFASRGTALPARLDKQSPNDRALRGLPLTGPRTVSERSSRGGGVLRGNHFAAAPLNYRSKQTNLLDRTK